MHISEESYRGRCISKNKLSEKQVREILSLYRRKVLSKQDLAVKYNVAYSTIHGIVEGKTWRHV